MPRISEKKTLKIKEKILELLFDSSPRSLFTSEIAEELARDEEFIKRLLRELHKEKFISKISKNNRGKNFLARRKWQLSQETYNAYKKLI